MPRHLPWVRILGEGTTIVVSILLALSADAWWGARADRADERVALGQLLAEFEYNAAQLDAVLAQHRRAQESARVLVGVAQRAVELDTDSLRHLVKALDRTATFNPELSVVESLIATDRLSIIRSDSLQLELAGFGGIVDDYTEEEVGLIRWQMGAQYEYFSTVVNWNDIWGDSTLQSDRVLSHLAGDERLESIAGYRFGFEDGTLQQAQPTEDAVQRILSLVRRSLARANR